MLKKELFSSKSSLFLGALVLLAMTIPVGSEDRYTGNVTVDIKVDRRNADYEDWDFPKDDDVNPPDPTGKITFPDGTVLRIRTHKDTWKASGMARNVSMKKGQRIQVYVVDYDNLSNVLIASGSIEFTGRRYLKARVDEAEFTFRLD